MYCLALRLQSRSLSTLLIPCQPHAQPRELSGLTSAIVQPGKRSRPSQSLPTIIWRRWSHERGRQQRGSGLLLAAALDFREEGLGEAGLRGELLHHLPESLNGVGAVPFIGLAWQIPSSPRPAAKPPTRVRFTRLGLVQFLHRRVH